MQFLTTLVLAFLLVARAQAKTATTEDECRQLAQSLGLHLGGAGYSFASSAFGTKGCYTYSTSQYAGHAYFGRGGTAEQLEAPVEAPKCRPEVSTRKCAPEATTLTTTTSTTMTPTTTTFSLPFWECSFNHTPATPWTWDPTCTSDIAGCHADGVHTECRFCGEAPYDPCPACEFVNKPLLPFVWDNRCDPEEYAHGCFADGVHFGCRFCGVEHGYDPCSTTTSTSTTLTTTTSRAQAKTATTEDECRQLAQSLGLHIGGAGYSFASSAYGTKGCYTYSTGEYAGHAYFGRGGTAEQMEAPVEAPKCRPEVSTRKCAPKGAEVMTPSPTTTSTTLSLRMNARLRGTSLR